MKISRAIVTVVVTAGITLAGAVSASAVSHGSCTDSNDRFCAFNYTGYSGELTSFKPVKGTTYSVADNLTSSVANHNPTVSVCGVEAEGWPDHTVLTVGPGQYINTLGSAANNTIEHFYGC